MVAEASIEHMLLAFWEIKYLGFSYEKNSRVISLEIHKMRPQAGEMFTGESCRLCTDLAFTHGTG